MPSTNLPAVSPGSALSSHFFELKSEIVGDSFRIDVGLPLGYEKENSEYPILFVMDGNFAFSTLHTYCLLQPGDSARPGFEPIIVVGVGYPNPNESLVRRARDFTPEDALPNRLKTDIEVGAKLLNLEKAHGGADEFLSFLQRELMPVLRANYRIKKNDVGIIGGSYGGLFAFHCLATQPSVFSRFGLISPGILSPLRGRLKNLFRNFGDLFDRDVRLFLSWGELEETGSDPTYADLAKQCLLMRQFLNAQDNSRMKWDSRRYDGESHLSIGFRAQCDAAQFLYRKQPIR